MEAMATRQPRRTRRRSAPATSLPRPTATEDTAQASGGSASRTRRLPGQHRAHHVTTDYRYVRKDLTAITVIGAIALAFIFGMAIYIGAL
jgi:hypothetical protein